MHLLGYLIQITAMVAIVSGSCSFFGHSCLGGHGKRASPASSMDNVPGADGPPTWPLDRPFGIVNSAINDVPIRVLDTKPLEALESLLVFNGIPKSAEHSRYLNRDYDD